ncbi:hypothetical protein EDM57_00390 [Brevibacillus gelatini]|uniref:Big-1 domain-containing protein n=1 Tax=Brevibacillus gelatini TaxID=1655277 RepID=A0A3M8BDS6_9BACL|nr:Ig-like domain-containing protein [Brevibacillus gelatini]RNB61581.1 hypothetical protein EDM57_00390 [Brevibacillus gelatini]
MNKKVALSLLSATVISSMAASAFAAPNPGIYMGGDVDRYYSLTDLMNLNAQGMAKFNTDLGKAGSKNIVFVDYDKKGAFLEEIFNSTDGLEKVKRDLKQSDFEGVYTQVKTDGTDGATYDPRNDIDPEPAGELKVESVSAITKNEVKVTFATDLTGKDIKPSNFNLVQKDNEYNEPYIDSVSVSGKVVTLTLGDNLISGKTYVVTVSGLSEQAQTKEVTYSLATPASVTIDTSYVTGKTGDQLKATVKDASGNDITGDYPVKWETNNANVDADGKLTGNIAAGTTILAKAYVMNGTTKVYSAQAVITVANATPTTYEGFTVDDDGTVADYTKLAATDIKTSLKMGETGYLFPFVKDQYGNVITTNSGFTFTSKNPTILVVDSATGKLTPVATGTAVVQVESGTFKKLISIEVKAAAKPTTLTVAESSVTLSDKAPAKAIKVTVKDQYGDPVSGATVTKTESTTTDFSDAALGNSGKTDAKGEITLTITPKAAGTEAVKLSVGAAPNAVEATVNVTVTASTGTVTGYKIVNSADDNVLDANDAADDDLTLKLYPVDANGNITGPAENAVWTVKDFSNGFVSIDNDGGTADGVTDSAVGSVTVTAKKKGTATLTAKVGSLEVGTFDVVVNDSKPVIGSVALTKATLTAKQSDADVLSAVLANITAKDTTGKGFDRDNDGTYEPTGDDILTSAEVAAIYSNKATVVQGDTDGTVSTLPIVGAGEATLTITFADSLNLAPLSLKVIVSDDVAPTVAAGKISITDNTTPAVDTIAGAAGAVTDGTKVSVYSDAALTTLVGTATVKADGSFDAIDLADKATGTVDYYVVAEDAAGNKAAAEKISYTAAK